MPSDKQPSKTAEHRRSNKPIMEKKRRARINNCLNELKNLLLEAMRKDPARHSKLEKADILEMTVKHLQNLQRQQMALTVAADPGVVTKYRAGFNECAEEVSRYVGTLDGIDSPVKQRLLNHLANCMNGMGVMTTSGSQQTCSRSNAGPNPALQLIPSRMPNGEIALLLPNQAMSGWPLNSNQRFLSIFNKNNNGTSPTLPVKVEPGVNQSTLLTVNVGYNRGPCPSPTSGEDMSVSSPCHSTESYRRRCDSRGSLSPAMSDYSDSNSRHHDFTCSNDRSNAGVQFEPDMNWPKSIPAEVRPPTCGSASPGLSNERLVRYDHGPAVNCPMGNRQNEPEVLVPVNLSKDAEKMWRPW